MTSKNSVLCLVMLGLISMGSLSQEKSGGAKRETVLDRVVYIEKNMIVDIPKISRLCDQLDLKKQRINVGDCELYCEQEGKKIPIVLLHGGPGATHHGFHPSFSMAKSFAQVIYYDQRGTGISGYCRGSGYSVDQAADDLENLRKALKIDKWIVLGHSYGGLLAQYYSLRYPESLRGLVLVGASEGMHVQMEPTRQYDYISKEELQRMREVSAEVQKYAKEKNLSEEQFMEIFVYNRHLNGDWKRQNFYRPSVESLARMARYEWKPGPDFRNDMGQSINKIDLEGAFQQCPIPTMILEGRWDLTWNTDKPEILHKNHPGSQLVMFERSSHSPFDDEPERFFQVLRDFTKGLPKISSSDISAWKAYLLTWKKKQEESPAYLLRATGNGHSSYEKISKMYSKLWLEQLNDFGSILRLGMALYDWERYEEALGAFQKLAGLEDVEKDKFNYALALVWQGQMLDLLGKREEAVSIYKKVVDMNITGQQQHDQFGLVISPSPYAAERLKVPFKRIENKMKD